MRDARIQITSAENGFLVQVTDPKIVAANNESDGVYKSADREFVFSTREKAMAWLKTNIDKYLPKLEPGEYDVAFNKASEEDNG